MRYDCAVTVLYAVIGLFKKEKKKISSSSMIVTTLRNKILNSKFFAKQFND